jgi:hypothetical protein
MSRAQGACSQGTPIGSPSTLVWAGISHSVNYNQRARHNHKTGQNVPVIACWRPLHVSVILVDDGPGDPKEKRMIGMKECHSGIKRSSGRF